VGRGAVTFLGFPDDGLCLLASKYLTVRTASFESPYTKRDSPPDGEQIIRGVQYRGADVRRELERVLLEFQPTLLVAPHPEDEHPDHCSTHIFLRDALAALSRDPAFAPPRILHYVVHYRTWPIGDGDAVRGQLRVPASFPAAEGTWRTLRLSRREAAAKQRALATYASQTLVIGRFMRGFAQRNELFLEGEPASLPECWCDGTNVATERPAASRRRAPPQP
jgi:LmbE family N-acetylglucosaminyl deacetylase